MVTLMYILSSVLVPVIVSVVVCVLILGRVYLNQIQPLIDQAGDIQAEVEKAVKQATSAMGTKSVQVRQDNKLEKMVAKDLLDQFPEVEMILGLLSPATAESIQENPERALRLIDRYKDFLPILTGNINKKPQVEYEF